MGEEAPQGAVEDGREQRMNYGQFIKKLDLPSGFTAPTRLSYEDIEATAITRTDLRDDVSGINASIALIQRTRGGGWPTEPVTEDFNFVDLVWHELEFREGSSFTYVVREPDGAYLGCCYLYPMGRRTQLTEQLLRYGVDVSWWVTPTAYAQGYYAKVYQALRHWLADEFPFWEAFYSNAEIPNG
jgi:hypothetical protein